MFIDGAAKEAIASENDVQSLARLIASNAVARSPVASHCSEYARRSSEGRPSGDSQDGGASQSGSTSAKIGPLRVFQTSNGNAPLLPRTGMSALTISIGTHSPRYIARFLPTSMRSLT